MNRVIRVSFYFAVLFAFICMGCEKPNPYGIETHYVEGQVTLDGKPIEDAVVSFVPKTPGAGEDASGRSKANGSYKLSSLRGLPESGAMEGEYVITVYKNEKVDLAVPQKTLDGEAITFEMKNIMPPDYKNPAKSPLKATVVRGKNKINIEVKSK
ncbi:MAG: hypothetical protein Q4G69_01535 [Planctomycetia bacterium]|nr:hypothetical protein [Planctomycetia bacterium]